MNFRIDSILTGTPKLLARGKESAIAKEPVSGPVMAGPLGLEGDAQADLRVHGGPEKAIHIYSRDHYALWLKELTAPAALELLTRPGAFGENLSVSGLCEQDACIGDIWQAGSATLQVSQGRQPCWKLNERFATADMSTRVQDSGRTGWYFRVVEPGTIAMGDTLSLVERPNPTWSVARVADVFYRDRMNFAALTEISNLPQLPENWRKLVLRRLESRQVEDWSKRLNGA